MVISRDGVGGVGGGVAGGGGGGVGGTGGFSLVTPGLAQLAGLLSTPRAEPLRWPFVPAERDRILTRAVVKHMKRVYGRTKYMLFEFVGHRVLADLHFVAPSRKRPWTTVFTTGMAAHAMTIHRKERLESASPYVELFMRLPADWFGSRLDPKRFDDPERRWPLTMLIHLVHMPHDRAASLLAGDTFSDADLSPVAPGVPFAGGRVEDGAGCEPSVRPMRRPGGGEVRFLSVVPLHPSELRALNSPRRKDALAALDREEVTDLLDPARRPVI